jgi:hypothetical protein
MVATSQKEDNVREATSTQERTVAAILIHAVSLLFCRRKSFEGA